MPKNSPSYGPMALKRTAVLVEEPHKRLAGPSVNEKFAEQIRWSAKDPVRPELLVEMRRERASYFCGFPLDLLDSALLPYIRLPPLVGRSKEVVYIVIIL